MPFSEWHRCGRNRTLLWHGSNVLRDAMQIDLGLRHRRDVVGYVFVSTVAASGATIIGVACLLGDHSIAWDEIQGFRNRVVPGRRN